MSTPALVRESVDKDLKEFEHAADVVTRIREHRNEQFMHLSERLLEPPFGVVPAEDSFAYEEMWQLLTTIGEILNRYSLFLDGTTMHMEVFREEQDFAYLLQKLTEALRDEHSGIQ